MENTAVAQISTNTWAHHHGPKHPTLTLVFKHHPPHQAVSTLENRGCFCVSLIYNSMVLPHPMKTQSTAALGWGDGQHTESFSCFKAILGISPSKLKAVSVASKALSNLHALSFIPPTLHTCPGPRHLLVRPTGSFVVPISPMMLCTAPSPNIPVPKPGCPDPSVSTSSLRGLTPRA